MVLFFIYLFLNQLLRYENIHNTKPVIGNPVNKPKTDFLIPYIVAKKYIKKYECIYT